MGHNFKLHKRRYKASRTTKGFPQFALLAVLFAELAHSVRSRAEALEVTASATAVASPEATGPKPAAHDAPITPLLLGISIVLLAAEVEVT